MNNAESIFLWVKNHKEVLEIIISIVTLLLINKGLGTWKNELNGTNKIKVANSIRARFYKIRDLINFARLSTYFKYEESPQEITDKNERLMYKINNRLLPVELELKELEGEYYQAIVLFGEFTRSPLQDVKNIFFKLNLEKENLRRFEGGSVEYSEAYHKFYCVENTDETKEKIDRIINRVDSIFNLNNSRIIDSLSGSLKVISLCVIVLILVLFFILI